MTNRHKCLGSKIGHNFVSESITVDECAEGHSPTSGRHRRPCHVRLSLGRPSLELLHSSGLAPFNPSFGCHLATSTAGVKTTPEFCQREIREIHSTWNLSEAGLTEFHSFPLIFIFIYHNCFELTTAWALCIICSPSLENTGKLFQPGKYSWFDTREIPRTAQTSVSLLSENSATGQETLESDRLPLFVSLKVTCSFIPPTCEF